MRWGTRLPSDPSRHVTGNLHEPSTSDRVQTHGTAPPLGKSEDGVASERDAVEAESRAMLDGDDISAPERKPVPGVVPLEAATPGSYRLPRDYPLPEQCLVWTYSKGSGPGGQAVNTSANKATLKVPIDRIAAYCTDIEMDILDNLREEAKTYLTDNDEIIVYSHEHRSLERNKRTCLKQVSDLLYAASYVPIPEERHDPAPMKPTEKQLIKKRIKTFRAKEARAARQQAKKGW